MGTAQYIAIPGTRTHELPPLLLHGHQGAAEGPDLESVMLEADDMLAVGEADAETLDQRRFDLALQLTAQYKGLMAHWQWGDSVLEWIRQCEITFEYEDSLRQLLHPDVWPHAGRASFVNLLLDKRVPTPGVGLERAVGLRLSFRQPPPIDCCTSQFLVYLNSSVGDSAYQAWSRLGPQASALFPPERFHFEVLQIGN